MEARSSKQETDMKQVPSLFFGHAGKGDMFL
jgi:hypothetical protein